MLWNIAPEYVSLVFISILLVFSREFNLIPTLKNKIFRLCLWFVFFEIIISITSIIAIENHEIVPIIVNHIIQTMYFLTSPLMAVFFLFYLIAVIWEDSQKLLFYFRIITIPYALYAVLVFTNPLTSLLYTIGESDGFTNGKGFFLVYIIPMLYIFSMSFVILNSHKKIEKTLMIILSFLPAISLLLVGMQWIFPAIILSGSAATSALLIACLYIQNKKIIIDDLTGFQNRKALSKVLELYVKRKWEMDIILISLDDFKLINDISGQLAGDNSLKAVSQYLMKVVPIKFIYRFSGDEFIIIIDKSIKIKVVDVVETIRKRFSDQWDCGVFRCMLTTSIAVVRFPDHTDTIEGIITLLEYCIDLSKKTGKGKDIFSDFEILGKMKRKSQILERMKQGLLEDIFEVYYQPIYSVEAKRFTSAEALLRLSDKELGAISPDEFIPIAEETGLIIDIGLIVVDKVCKFISELDERGVKIDAISINISAMQLISEDLVDNLIEIIKRYQTQPWKLRLEVTESIFIDKCEQMSNIMRKLSEYGIKFYLDDFGTGYSNITNIVELPFEFIKIDKSILYGSIISNKFFSVMNGFSKTFSDVGMKIVVEGVETPEHSRMAAQINADYMQGFLFAHPMPASEVIKYLGKSLPDEEA